MEGLTITRTDHGGHGEYRARPADSEHTGWLSWTRRTSSAGPTSPADDVRIAEHTVVPHAIGGHGIAGELVRALVADAREQGFRIDPQCSYVAAQFARHPEWADLRAD